MLPIRKLPRKQPGTEWSGQAAEPPGQGTGGCGSHPPTGQDLTRAAAEIISGLHKAKEELAQELEINLKQLHAVLEETQRIARQMKAVLSEIRGESQAQQEQQERSKGAVGRRSAGQGARRGQADAGLPQGYGQARRSAVTRTPEAAPQNQGQPGRSGAGGPESQSDPETWDPVSEGSQPLDFEQPATGAFRPQAEPRAPWEPPAFPTRRDEWEPLVAWEPPEPEDPWMDEDEW